jgi:hypothetical protein
MDGVQYDRPGWGTCGRCGGDRGISIRLTVAYNWPGRGARISDG